MLTIRRILFPTDFSACADQALGMALRMARLHGAELHMLHALVLHQADPADPAHRFPDEGRILDELRKTAERRMAAVAEREEESADLRIERVHRRAISPVPAILDYIDEADIDLVVMGTHGRRALGRLLLGSVTREVVRLSPAPVLTMRQRDRDPENGRIDRIAVPVDFSDHSRLAHDVAVELAQGFGARLQLLHVVEEALYPDFYYPILASAEIANPQLHERARTTLAEWMGKAGGSEVEREIHVTAGRAPAEIAAFAEEHDSDLIVICTHGRTGLERVLVGSVAEGVIRRAPCPVLTVKAFGRQLLDR